MGCPDPSVLAEGIEGREDDPVTRAQSLDDLDVSLALVSSKGQGPQSGAIILNSPDPGRFLGSVEEGIDGSKDSQT